jgi:hypothetical protein
MNNFKGFASKVRAQAVDAASKLPSLDDMASKDDYIHSAEFKVRNHHEQTTNTTEANEVHSSDNETASSWSLLDRRIPSNSHLSSLTTSSVSSHSSSAVVVESATEISKQSQPQERKSQPTIVSSKRQQTASGMLSIVADALNDTFDAPQQKSQIQYDVKVPFDNVHDDEVLFSSSGDDSWDEGDEEDPILSMIRQNKTTNKEKINKKPFKKRNPNRFLEDLDGLETTDMEEGRHQKPLKHQASAIAAVAPTAMPTTRKELGNWMKAMASSQVDKILRRQPEAPSLITATYQAPLTSHFRNTFFRQMPPEEEYLSADSKHLLGDDELAQLSKLKASQKNSLVDICYEYANFAFIFLTLVLAIYVYFYSSKGIGDEVI